MTKPITFNQAAATLGRKGGQSRSERKVAAVRRNGQKGGRPTATIVPSAKYLRYLDEMEGEGLDPDAESLMLNFEDMPESKALSICLYWRAHRK